MTGSAVQTLIVLLIVGAAAFYVGRRLWRTIAAARASKAAGCGVGCGCEDTGSRPSALGSRLNTREASPHRGIPRQ